MVDKVVRSAVTPLAEFISSAVLSSVSISSDALNTLLINTINDFITTQGNGIDIPLSGVAVDFETNKANIESVLIANPVWKDSVLVETGQIIIMMIATALTYQQMNIVRAAQETMSDTIRLNSSALAATRHLGVRIARQIPALHLTMLNRSGDLTSSLEIPPYSTFTASASGSAISLFNRDPIIFPPGMANITPINLYEGQAGNVASFISTGQPDQRFIIGQNNYAVSDVDVVCSIDGTSWTRAEFNQYFSLGLWEYGNSDLVFTDDTTADGNVEIGFGNGIFGQIPATNAQINLTYALTNGASGNVNMIGATVTPSSYANILGNVLLAGVGGTDALDPLEYMSLAPGQYAAKYRAVTRQDHAVMARRYPGVIDAMFEGQQEIAPSDLRQMLISRCTLLTNTTWGSSDFDNFKIWFENLDMANMRIYQNPATAIPIDIIVSVYCFSNTVLSSLQNQIITNIKQAFRLRAGILGYTRTISDIGDIVRQTNRVQIDYYDVLAPSVDISAPKDHYVTLRNVFVNMFYTTRVGI